MRIRLGCLLLLALLVGVTPAIVNESLAQDRNWRQDRQERLNPRQERRQQEQQRQAQDRQDNSEGPARSGDEGDPAGVLKLLPADAVSEKQIIIGGRHLAYTATAGTLSIYNPNGERVAAVFYTAYVAKAAPGTRRPITFAFNGGPGAASAYLHLGLVGPRIADFGHDGRDGATAKLRDNPETWLAFTDLVMIDPVGTGWSRPAKPDGAKPFLSVQGDADSVAKVISLYVARNDRGASPKYLLGESYGGFRAAKVARTLHTDQGIIVSGIIMVSPMLETSFQWGRSERDPFRAALVFPSFAATELERTKQFTPQAMAEAERFALTEYLPTLAGPPPTGEQATAFYGKIARMTGLPVDVVAKSGGYVRSAFMERLSKQGLRVSAYDASAEFPAPYYEDTYGGDPILDGYLRSLSGIFASYARNELGFKTDITYTLLARQGWDWGRGGNGVSDDLRAMLSLDTNFRLLVTHGRSDLVTPYGVNRYLLDQLRPGAAPDRVQLRTFNGGHMFYFNDADRRTFTADAKLFYQGGK